MEDLFSTHISVNNESISYRVSFDHEKYVFVSEGGNQAISRFSFRREHDEWMDEQPLPPGVKSQAVDALEKYLLKQH